MSETRFYVYCVLGFVIFCITCFAIYNSTAEDITITIQEKERIAENRDGKYMYYTESEVFQNTDSWTFGKFDSSDLYSKLDVGMTCNVKVAGWRIPFFSAYRNIIRINSCED